MIVGLWWFCMNGLVMILCVLLNGDGCCGSGIDDGGGLLFSIVFSCLLKMGLCVCVCSIVSCKCRCSGNGCIMKM